MEESNGVSNVTIQMEDDLSLLCGNFSPTKKDVEVDVSNVEDTILCGKCCLIGKVIAEKPFDLKAFHTTMLKI